MKYTKEELEELRKDPLMQFMASIFQPALINSPLRKDEHPSFSIYSPDGEKVFYIDYADRRVHGDIYSLMQKCFNLSFSEVIRKIGREMKKPSQRHRQKSFGGGGRFYPKLWLFSC